MKKSKSVNFDLSNIQYLESVKVKSISHTVELIVSQFLKNGTPINFARCFNELQNNSAVSLSLANIEYLEAHKNGSFSFTLNCLIATAKDLNLKAV